MTVSAQTVGGGTTQGALSLPWIIAASSVGTLIEWYDFYIYGVLAVFFAKHFFPSGNDNLALLARYSGSVTFSARSTRSSSGISAT